MPRGYLIKVVYEIQGDPAVRRSRASGQRAGGPIELEDEAVTSTAGSNRLSNQTYSALALRRRNAVEGTDGGFLLRDQWASADVDMPWDSIRFDGSGQNKLARGVILQYIDNVYRVIWSFEAATAQVV